MDLKLLEYIVAIADYGNITRAAQALYITQSGLNQQLIRLEKELDTQLFYRTKRSLHPTQAGKIYIENAREILRIQRNTYLQLHDINNSISGELSFGLSWEHGINMFVEIFPEFVKRYPGINVRLYERRVNEQQEMLQSGRLDLAFIMLTEKDKVDLECIHLCDEEFILGVPRSHPIAQRYAAPPGEPLTTIDLQEFKGEKFSFMFSSSTQRSAIDPLFREAGFAPDVIFETSMNYALAKMVCAGLCCTIMPQDYAINDENGAWFRLSSRPKWEWVIAYSGKLHLNDSVRYLISLAQRYAYGRELQWFN